MGDNVAAAVLREAARIEGSTQGLATRLRAPESTLLLWMEGRAQVPMRALLNSIDFIVQWELQAKEVKDGLEVGSAARDTMVLAIGKLAARCDRCDGAAFRPVAAGQLRLTSRLSCVTCGEEVASGVLIGRLAKEMAHRSRSSVPRTPV